jgi:chemotaxis protein CheC
VSASEIEIDMYNELANIGGGNAATALSQMLNVKVDLGLPKTAELTLDDLEELIGDDEGEVAVVILTTVGDLAGTIVLLMSDPETIGEALGVTEEFMTSALGEIGNIVGSRFLISVGQMMMVEGEVEPPAVGLAPRAAAFETVVALAAESEPFFVLRTDLDIEALQEHNELLYFPATATIERLRDMC